jgi:hypothetical protein
MNEPNKTESQPSVSGKMSPESSTPKTTPSGAFWQDLPEKTFHLSHQGENGRTRVVCVVPRELSRGGSSMPNTSDWPNDAAVCLLSQVLEKDLIPAKYCLSLRACAGLLHRAEKRGKTLPPLLERALRQVVLGNTERGSEPLEAAGGDLGGGSESLAVSIAENVINRQLHNGGNGVGAQDEINYTLNTAGVHAVAFAQNTRNELREMEVVGALAANPGMKQTSYIRRNLTVRRLTPTEYARLQGFPDDHCLIPWRGTVASDGPQYKAYGNSMAVPVMRWIGERIKQATQSK